MNRKAFTLIELLVVIGVIGILVAILLPAVQMAREAGRRVTCANNARQLSLSLMNYESSHGKLPIGLRSFDPLSGAGRDPSREFYGMTWITRILPFVEQNAMWERALDDYKISPVPFGFHAGLQSVLPVVACSSDPAAGVAQFTHDGLFVACTNFLGVNGTNFTERDGVFTYDKEIRFSMVSDGLSNTLMLGERPPSPDFWYGWWYATGAGSQSTGDVSLGVAELNPTQASGISSYLDSCPAGPYSYVAGSNKQCDALHFWSYHPSGSNFSRADGSVSFVLYSIDSSVLESLSTRSGGEVIVY
jgi:prepilin-type N-terminal cleavage/methylation domain-containing protein/prepilin-type processing-associated H-X9-DG protein